MPILSITLAVLVIWWFALAVCVAIDEMRRSKSTAQPLQEQPTASPEMEESSRLRWPSWSESCAQPRQFLVLIGAGLIYGTCLVFIWPAFVILKIWPRKQDDHVS